MLCIQRALHEKHQGEHGKERNGPADGETAEQFVFQALTLCDGRETAVLDLFGVKFERVFGEFETLLDERSEFTNTATLLPEDLLGFGCPYDDLDHGKDKAQLG
jgi:hypothetical protein